MNVTLDTNVLLSATLWNGSEAQKLLFELIKLDIKIYTSVEIISEFVNVLERDFDYSDKEITNILEILLSGLIIISPSEKIKIIEEDPKDDKILECAVASNSRYLISYDRHLLKLKEFRNIKIITPTEARTIL